MRKQVYNSKRFLSLKLDHTLSYYCLGQIYHKRGEFGQALDFFDKALKINKNEIEPDKLHIALATTYVPLGRLDEAIQEFKEALACEPERRDLHLDIGESYFQLKKYDEAISHFEQTDPDDMLAKMYLAKGYWFKGDKERSISVLQETTENFPLDPEPHAYLGYLLLELQDYEQAIEPLRKALELSKTPDEDVLSNLGEAYYQTEQLEEALKVYIQAIELFPNNTFFCRRIGFIYKKQNNLDATLQIWRRMVEINDTDVDSHRTLALGLRLSGDLEAALKEIRRAISLDPACAPAHTSEGSILLDMSRQEEATASFERAVDLGDDWPRLDLAEIHYDLGNTDEAIHYAKTYIEAARDNPELENNVKDAREILNALQAK